ncbi:MAG: hypothetical protein M3416_01595 [Acidobacteriota bacterium]|nr:hypothetical protein [Acidobacteriota bacterium]
MPLKAISAFRPKSMMYAACLLFALYTAGAAASGWLSSSVGSRAVPAGGTPAMTTATSAQSLSAPVYRRSLRVWVHGDDIRPALIEAEPGPVVVRALNETGADISLVVERVSEGRPAERAARVAVTPRDKQGRQEIVLAAGEYVYYEESRPDIRGRLVVAGGQ